MVMTIIVVVNAASRQSAIYIETRPNFFFNQLAFDEKSGADIGCSIFVYRFAMLGRRNLVAR